MEAAAPFLIPAVAAVLVAVVGALTNVSLRKREGKVDEVTEAFNQRGLLVLALKEDAEVMKGRLTSIQGDLASCKDLLRQIQEQTS